MDPALAATSSTGQAADFWQVLAVPVLYSLLVWMLFLRRQRLPSGPMHRRSMPHIIGRIIAWEIMLAVVMTVLGMLAFVFFFADHRPYQFPFNLTRLVMAVELVAVMAVDVALLRWLQRLFSSIGASARVQRAFGALNVVMFMLTTWPLVFVLLAGD